MATLLITGAAGFVGHHLALRLAGEGHRVVGVDDLNRLFFPTLKEERARRIAGTPGCTFRRMDVADPAAVDALFREFAFDGVVHFAAQTGVRFSKDLPFEYERSNIQGTLAVFDAAARHGRPRVVYASSSSVYGDSPDVPWREDQAADQPVSLYAATKRADELMARAYLATHGLSTVGLRFFTVYGPFGRPDMAVWTFAEAIASGEPVPLYDGGRMKRDFTFVDDAVEVTRALLQMPDLEGARVFNVGPGDPQDLDTLLRHLEEALGRPARRQVLPAQAGDVPATWADPTALRKAIGFHPRTPLREGVQAFVDWYRAHPDLVAQVRRERAASGQPGGAR
ncbi:MAG TPA: NAD-dependent epimerase/dehydratase family protein [Myxococcota bacterium]|nr:NAD-dependent epimerase/dehydratase family protein [Myxococcota bacterium]HQK49949.1 NAD-dependent epimerase/dehydratase family protein [Myxococcota bacterium]